MYNVFTNSEKSTSAELLLVLACLIMEILSPQWRNDMMQYDMVRIRESLSPESAMRYVSIDSRTGQRNGSAMNGERSPLPPGRKGGRLVADLQTQSEESAKLEQAIKANLKGLGYGE